MKSIQDLTAENARGFHAMFATDRGQEFIEVLEAGLEKHKIRLMSPKASEAELRFHQGQAAAYHSVLSFIARAQELAYDA